MPYYRSQADESGAGAGVMVVWNVVVVLKEEREGEGEWFRAMTRAVYLDYTYYINILEDAYGC